MTDDYEYHRLRRPDRTYISRPFTEKGSERMKRLLYKVIDGAQDEFGKVHDELVLHERRPQGRVEVRAVLYEDDRGIERITIIKFNRDSPEGKYQYTFERDDLRRFSALLQAIGGIPFARDEG